MGLLVLKIGEKWPFGAKLGLGGGAKNWLKMAFSYQTQLNNCCLS